mmetsp:Transcript_148435/g.413545  ORF Transcript_148435/g.413545 Transcript_148435/m.413545 type:complete len:263 (+) Transcript_148435:78-866(+)
MPLQPRRMLRLVSELWATVAAVSSGTCRSSAQPPSSSLSPRSLSGEPPARAFTGADCLRDRSRRAGLWTSTKSSSWQEVILSRICPKSPSHLDRNCLPSASRPSNLARISVRSSDSFAASWAPTAGVDELFRSTLSLIADRAWPKSSSLASRLALLPLTSCKMDASIWAIQALTSRRSSRTALRSSSRSGAAGSAQVRRPWASSPFSALPPPAPRMASSSTVRVQRSSSSNMVRSASCAPVEPAASWPAADPGTRRRASTSA